MHHVTEYRAAANGLEYLRIVGTFDDRSDADYAASCFQDDQGGGGYEYRAEEKPGSLEKVARPLSPGDLA